MKEARAPTCTVEDSAERATLTVRLAGDWKIGAGAPGVEEALAAIEGRARGRRLRFEAGDLGRWDSSLLTFLRAVMARAAEREIEVAAGGLPPGVVRLLDLAAAVPERKGARRSATREPLLARVGAGTVAWAAASRDTLTFVGETALAFARFLRGPARFRRSDFVLLLQDCGAGSLPIVSLISFLVGLILAFVGAVQLAHYGAQIYVASLVGIAMVRVLGAVMAGIIMAGRTGAAYAAQLGTMQVNEEIDALKTMGISPVEFLVLPRVIALTVMMPFLCLYADLMGVLGGLAVGVTMLGLNPVEYFNQTQASLSLAHLGIGLFHSLVFGILISLAGCLKGITCGRSSSAVGFAATSAVVSGVVSLVVATAIITLCCNVLGI